LESADCPQAKNHYLMNFDNGVFEPKYTTEPHYDITKTKYLLVVFEYANVDGALPHLSFAKFDQKQIPLFGTLLIYRTFTQNKF